MIFLPLPEKTYPGGDESFCKFQCDSLLVAKEQMFHAGLYSIFQCRASGCDFREQPDSPYLSSRLRRCVSGKPEQKRNALYPNNHTGSGVLSIFIALQSEGTNRSPVIDKRNVPRLGRIFQIIAESISGSLR